MKYRCELCKGRYFKKYSKWIEKHYTKYHPGEKLKLKRIKNEFGN